MARGNRRGQQDHEPVPRLPSSLRSVLPAATADAWRLLAGRLPAELYLGGGTALAVRLGHRTSRDLDFFYHHGAVDLEQVAGTVSALGVFAVTRRAPGTLNGEFDGAKLQFLHADEGRPQRRLDEPEVIGGLPIAGLRDIVAMKLQAVVGRGEMRDYFDLMSVEERTSARAEEGLGWWLARYGPEDADQQLVAVARALGYLGDIADDPLLPSGASERTRVHWERRGPEVLRALSRY